MAAIPRSPHAIEVLNFTSNRRTSMTEFYESSAVILGHILRPGEVHAPEEREAHEKAVYAFNQIAQRARKRRLPANLQEAWPYYGYPIDTVSGDLGAHPNLLTRRAEDIGFWRWPAPSDDEYVFVAAQLWIGVGLETEKAMFYIQRTDNVEQAMEQVRGYLRVGLFFGPHVECEMHFEIEGRRFGPVLTTQQWQACLDRPGNETRINLLVVVVA